jgi:hypothetical protein
MVKSIQELNENFETREKNTDVIIQTLLKEIQDLKKELASLKN